LAFGIGGAVGTALSPLPWKLTDDLSIWTQNWPWTPVPPHGEVTQVDSVCTLCPGGCGISVRKVEDRVVKIEGMPGHPVNDGGICLLGASGAQLLYGPSRIEGPLKRVGRRGDGRWQPVSWKAAVAEVAGKLGVLRSGGEPHTLGCLLRSDRGTVPGLFSRLLTVFGSPNLMRMPSIQDTYELTLYQMQGALALPGFDVDNTDFLLSFGSGYIQGWGSPVHMFRAHSRWRNRGGRVVQVEPRLSISAAKADDWLAIKPGTEAALAMGLSHVIITESLYDRDFIENRCRGFESWVDAEGRIQPGFKQRVLNTYTPAKVSEITGIAAADVVRLARDFAKAARPLAICGRGRGRVPGDLGAFMAVHALNALCGSIQRAGGVWAVPEPDYINWFQPEMDKVAATGMQQSRLDGAGGPQYPLARYLTSYLAEIINAGKGYPLKALLVAGDNPAYTLPAGGNVRKALDSIPFIVSFSSFMDETTRMADLVLPNHIYLERLEDVPLAQGFSRPLVQLCKPVTAPQFNTRHSGDVVIDIARALGGSVATAFPWKSYADCLKETLGGNFQKLMRQVYMVGRGTGAPGHNAAFETASGKFEFTNPEFKIRPDYEPIEAEGDAASFPLVLVPYDSMRLASGFVADSPFMVKAVDDTVLKGRDILVEINPQTARKYGLADGAIALLRTPRGKARVKIYHFEGLMPGLVAMPTGLGHSAYDEYIGGKGVNFNRLIGPVQDPVSGLDAAWGIRAKLTRV